MVHDHNHGKFICFTVCLIAAVAASSADGQFTRYSSQDDGRDGVLRRMEWFERGPAVNRMNQQRERGGDEVDYVQRLREFGPEPVLEAEEPQYGDLQLMEPEIPRMRFPWLKKKHRQFAVNPAFPSYYNRELQHLEEDIVQRQGPRRSRTKTSQAMTATADDDNPEVAEDPFKSNSERQVDDVTRDQDDDAAAAAAASGVSSDAILKKASASEGGPAVSISNLDPDNESGSIKDIYFTIIVAGCSAIAAFTIVLAGVVYHRLQRNAKAAEDVEYPAYGATGPTGKDMSPSSAGGGMSGGGSSGGGDRKLAQNAQMYHYQHQKQQMIAFDSHQNGGNRNRMAASDDESDDGEEGDYTVYECPGLAPTGEMEVRNPMFSDDQTTPKATQK